MAITTTFIDGGLNPVATNADMKKTLFIGIGGSGKEVLMRLRRKFYAATENPYGFDFIKYLWIDTDISGVPISSENWDVIGQNIQFGVRNNIHESLSVSIQPAVLNNFYDQVPQYPHIKHWLPIDALRPLGANALMNGAKAIRPLGRLAFSWHADTIKNNIHANLLDLNVVFNVPGVDVDDSISIYIVGSLAGGTGSGMFLEIAKLIKANWPQHQCYGVFFLSDIFEDVGDNRVRNSNCYASLQELDFYQTAANALDPLIGKERHMFEFVEPNGAVRSFELPLYNNIFLISKEYYKSPGEQDFADPFEMVAEIFYFDFDRSDFGAQKRSQAVNGHIAGSAASVKFVWQDGDKEVSVENTYSSDYSSYGLAGIFLNISKMKNWASYKYILDILKSHNLEHPAKSQLFELPNGTFAVKEFGFENILGMISKGNHANTVEEAYRSKLESAKQESLTKIASTISFDYMNLGTVQDVCHNAFNRIDSFISNQQELMNLELTEYQGTPGDSLQGLKANLEKTLKTLYLELEKLMYSILSRTEDGGPANVREMFSRVNNLLTQMTVSRGSFITDTTNLKNKLPEEQPKRPEIVVDSHIGQLLSRIKECDEIPFIFPFYKNRAKRYYEKKLSRELEGMNRTIKKQIDDYFIEWKQILVKRYEVVYREKLIELYDAAKARILEIIRADRVSIDNHSFLGLSPQLQSYQDQVSDLINYYDSYESDLRRVITTSINRKMILDETLNLDQVYKDFVSNLGDKSWLTAPVVDAYNPEIISKHLSNQDLNEPSQKFVRTLALYSRYCISGNLPELKRILIRNCQERFNQFMQDDSVLNRLNQLLRSRPAETQNSIRNMLSNFNFRLALSERYPSIDNRVSQTAENNRLPGLPRADAHIETLLGNLGTIGQVKYHGSDESILFYSETFGYPLFALKDIQKLEHEYRSLVERDGISSKQQRYTDIVTDYLRPLVIPSDITAMKQLLSSWEMLYEAIVLRVIRYESKEWKMTVAFAENLFAAQNISLGRTLEAAALHLSQAQPLQQAVKEQTYNRQIENYGEEEDLQEIYFALFGNFNQVLSFSKAQFNDRYRPKSPQEYVLEKLLIKYRAKYIQALDTVINEDEVTRKLAEEYRNRHLVRSGYADAVHTEGLSISPKAV